MVIPRNPRKEIEELIRQGDLEGLLRKAGALHGHFCPYLALGVRASHIGLRALGIGQNPGMERVLAIVETNNCFSDGIQMVTGCSFANNALIYKDLGKTTVTIAKRQGPGVRVALKAGYSETFDARYPEAGALFEKIVVRREEPTEDERNQFMRLWAEASFAQLELAEEEVFDIEQVNVEVPPFAPIYASATCSVCGEPVMETRVRVQNGKPVCMTCAAAEYYSLDGSGISVKGGKVS